MVLPEALEVGVPGLGRPKVEVEDVRVGVAVRLELGVSCLGGLR